jgi:hypothetical protein
MNNTQLERTEEICADDSTGTAEHDHIEGHGEICGRTLLRESYCTGAVSTVCPSDTCEHHTTVTRSFGPHECPRCSEELPVDEEDFIETDLFCRVHGSKVPVKSHVEKNIAEREEGNSPLSNLDL